MRRTRQAHLRQKRQRGLRIKYSRKLTARFQRQQLAVAKRWAKRLHQQALAWPPPFHSWSEYQAALELRWMILRRRAVQL